MVSHPPPNFPLEGGGATVLSAPLRRSPDKPRALPVVSDSLNLLTRISCFLRGIETQMDTPRCPPFDISQQTAFCGSDSGSLQMGFGPGKSFAISCSWTPAPCPAYVVVRYSGGDATPTPSCHTNAGLSSLRANEGGPQGISPGAPRIHPPAPRRKPGSSPALVGIDEPLVKLQSSTNVGIVMRSITKSILHKSS
jgi:hypothetical protein